jgi:ring-1,2-phenylacetyl-CoA epoxidase subunit PaaE
MPSFRTFVGFAAGRGITPLVSVLRAGLKGNHSNRFILFCGNSSTAHAVCLDELLDLKNRYLERLALHFVMSEEPQEVPLYNGRLDAERVRELAQSFLHPAEVAEYFVCGPGNMLEQVTSVLRQLNVSSERIHGEHFTFESALSKTASTSTDGSAGSSPARGGQIAEVQVLMDGRRRTFRMRMNDETVLDAAERAGLDLPFSCRAGVCSTCRIRVLRGEVEMAQNYSLETWELDRGYVLACQSRVKTARLELDYDGK